MKWILERFPHLSWPCASYNNFGLLNAGVIGDIQILDWIHDHYPKAISQNAALHSFYSGQIEVLEWFEKKGVDFRKFSDRAIEEAASQGHLDIVQWLISKETSFSFSQETIDKAAANGHLELVESLRSRGGKCSRKAFVGAATFGHQGILESMFQKEQDVCTEACLVDAMHEAAWMKHLSTVIWLYNKCNYKANWKKEKARKETIANAVLWEARETAAYLFQNRPAGWTSAAKVETEFGDKILMSQWLETGAVNRINRIEVPGNSVGFWYGCHTVKAFRPPFRLTVSIWPMRLTFSWCTTCTMFRAFLRNMVLHVF